jgi:hypothetical protein
MEIMNNFCKIFGLIVLSYCALALVIYIAGPGAASVLGYIALLFCTIWGGILAWIGFWDN